MKTEVRTVTPEVAKEMLKRNHNNRKLSGSHVDFLSKQMKDGKWQFDGQPIRLDTHGNLLDGQHRLNAVVASKVDIDFLIVSGLKQETFKTMDTGKNRTAGDVLSTVGVAYHNDIARIAKLLINLEQGRRGDGGLNRIDNTAVMEWYEKNQDIVEVIKRADVLRGHFSSVLSRSFIAGLLRLFSSYNVKEAEVFMTRLCTGLALETDDPIFVLRKKLIQDRMSKARLPQREKLAIIFKAWNAHRIGRKITFLRWNKEKEEFPDLI